MHGEFFYVFAGLQVLHEDKLTCLDIASDFAASLAKEHVSALRAVEGECSGILFQVLQAERESVCVVVVAHVELILDGLMLDALTVSQNNLSVDDLLNVLKLRIGIGFVTCSAVLHIQDDLVRTVDAHGERSRLQGEQIFIIAEHLEHFGRFLDAFLLYPSTEPVKESAQTELIVAIASEVIDNMESEEVIGLRLLANSLHEVVEFFKIETTSQVDAVQASEQVSQGQLNQVREVTILLEKSELAFFVGIHRSLEANTASARYNVVPSWKQLNIDYDRAPITERCGMHKLKFAGQAVLLKDAEAHRHVWLSTNYSLNTYIVLMNDHAKALLLFELNLILVPRAHALVLKASCGALEAFNEFTFESQGLIVWGDFADRDAGKVGS